MTLAGDAVEPAAGTSWSDALHRLGTDRLLVLLAGACAIGFGTLAALLELAGGRVGPSGFAAATGAAAVFAYAVALVFGAFLLLAFGAMRAKPTEGAVLALAFSLVLIFFAGLAGTIAGLLGLVGSLLGLLKNVKLTA
jgi:hypothetical protein